MDVLEKLFGSSAKVKIVKLFLFNPEMVFDTDEVAARAKVQRTLARRELMNLEREGFVKQKKSMREIKVRRGGKMMIKKSKARGYCLNVKFEYLGELYNFLSGKNSFKTETLVQKIGKYVKLDLLVVSGFFLKQGDARLDLLIVGDGGKEELIESAVRDIEAGLGREITYAVFTTREFKYRLSVFDKLLRDVLDYPHEKLVNRLGI